MKKRFADRIAPKKKWKKWHIILLAVVLFLVVVVGGAFFTANHILNKMNRVDKSKEDAISRDMEDFDPDGDLDDTMDPEDAKWALVNVMRSKDVKNILLIGQDRRPGETGRTRSDSMIICSINKKSGVITLVSLMRDLYVPIPNFTDNRINAAYAFGGMTLLDEVIRRDFGVVIDGNVEVDFNGFINAMTPIAPLNIELKENEAAYLNRGHGWNLHAGVNALNPQQLLAYARIRHVGNSDFERTDRQRRVLDAAFQKLKTLNPGEILQLVDAVLPSVTTDMDNIEIMSYAFYYITDRPTMGENHRLPVSGGYSNEVIRGMMVLVPDLVENARALQTYLYGRTVN